MLVWELPRYDEPPRPPGIPRATPTPGHTLSEPRPLRATFSFKKKSTVAYNRDIFAAGICRLKKARIPHYLTQGLIRLHRPAPSCLESTQNMSDSLFQTGNTPSVFVFFSWLYVALVVVCSAAYSGLCAATALAAASRNTCIRSKFLNPHQLVWSITQLVLCFLSLISSTRVLSIIPQTTV